MNDFILIAVTDPILAPEATHAAAATGREVISCTDPRDIARHIHRAAAVIADRDTAGHIAGCGRSGGVYFVAPDPGPIDFEAAMTCHADAAFVLPAESTELLAALANVGQPTEESGPGMCIAVEGSAGGLGVSTLAAALALTAAPAVLVDAAAHRGGLDLVLGLEDEPGARWPDVNFRAGGDVSGADIIRAVPSTPSGVAVLSGARSTVAGPSRVRRADVDAAVMALRGHELVVVDGMATDATDHVVVLTSAQVRPATAAAQMLAELAAEGVPASLVVARSTWASMSLEEVERLTHHDVVATLPQVRGLAKEMELTGMSQPPRPLRQAARLVLEHAGWVA